MQGLKLFKGLLDPHRSIFDFQREENLPFKQVVRTFTVPFGGSVSKSSTLTRKTRFLFDVILQEYYVHFARNQKRQLRVSLHVGGGGTNADPTVFKSDPDNPTLYLVGDGNTRQAQRMNVYIQKGQFLTAYGSNQSPAYDLTLDVEFIVQEVS